MWRYGYISVLCVLSALCSVPAFAHDGFEEPVAPDPSVYRHTVGFTAGMTTGLGLTYRGTQHRWFGQVAFMPAWTKDSGGNFFGGLQLGRVLQQANTFYLNAALGSGLMITDDEVCTYDSPDSPFVTSCERQYSKYLAAGPSIGIGKVWGDHFQLEVYLPIAVVWELGVGLDSVVPYPGVTIGYQW